MSTTVTGALVIVSINGIVYNEATSVSWSLGGGVKEVFGIDCQNPQEIVQGQQTVSGSISGLVLDNSGGLQGNDAVPLVSAAFSQPYISIRVRNRRTGESLFFSPKSMIANQNYSVSARGLMTLSFDFRGQVAYQALDEV